MRMSLLLTLLLTLYLVVLTPFNAYLKQKPYEVKLGYVPRGEVLRYISATKRTYCCIDGY